MKISIINNILKEGVGICEKISSKNINLPILNNILFDCDGGSLKIIATNLEIGVEVDIPIKIENKGKIAIPANILNSLLSNLHKDSVLTLESQGNNLLVFSENNSVLIKSQPAEDFPTLPHIKTDNIFYIPVDDFIFGLKSVLYSCSFSGIKPEISSVYIISDKGTQLTFAATDSFRLAERKFDYFFSNFGPILLPYKTIIEIMRIFDGKDGKIKVCFNKNQINFEIGNIKLISRLVDGIFPDYQQIIPKKFITDVVLDKESFIESVKLSGVFVGKLNELNLIINPEDGILTTRTVNDVVGDNTSNIPAKITGEKLKITFNHKYISDCLSSINSPEIILRFSGEGKPLLISGTQDNSFHYLIMPMSV